MPRPTLSLYPALPSSLSHRNGGCSCAHHKKSEKTPHSFANLPLKPGLNFGQIGANVAHLFGQGSNADFIVRFEFEKSPSDHVVRRKGELCSTGVRCTQQYVGTSHLAVGKPSALKTCEHLTWESLSSKTKHDEVLKSKSLNRLLLPQDGGLTHYLCYIIGQKLDWRCCRFSHKNVLANADVGLFVEPSCSLSPLTVYV
ncbi:hypothetical protein L873DRAFT_1820087 [Choiromyces venosus 120613-1]|uniref:Uncharacterized protein n=1 Tax=Choiromyces venosus 120613-1 TaxID=1336337 RepID=A0A3N4IYN4_9PEZI|nr:hypothetical protein L873DRAFT_1823642 [Choiromyces venosus 120613-1]RPA90986.1 hypothetical protein L873DRAFT_1820087 [Choiromyces venosus 120613-1]